MDLPKNHTQRLCKAKIIFLRITRKKTRDVRELNFQLFQLNVVEDSDKKRAGITFTCTLQAALVGS